MAVTNKPYVSTRKRVKAAATNKPAIKPIEAKKRGRPAGSKNKPKADPLTKAYEASLKVVNQKPVNWEALAKKLQAALSAQIRECQELEKIMLSYQQRIFALEDRSWLSRLFNLKG